MEHYLLILNKLKTSLEVFSSISLKEFSVESYENTESADFFFSLMDKNIGFQFEKGIEFFFKDVKKLSIAWGSHAIGNTSLLGGEAYFNSLPYAITTDWRNIIVGEKRKKSNAPYFDFCQKIKLFDRKDYSHTPSYGAFQIEPNDPNPRIWYWLDDDNKYPLTLKFEAYIEEMIRCKGAYNWQYFFIDLEAIDLNDAFFTQWIYGIPRETLKPMEEFLTVMPKIFLDFDITPYKVRYERIKDFVQKNSK